MTILLQNVTVHTTLQHFLNAQWCIHQVLTKKSYINTVPSTQQHFAEIINATVKGILAFIRALTRLYILSKL